MHLHNLHATGPFSAVFLIIVGLLLIFTSWLACSSLQIAERQLRSEFAYQPTWWISTDGFAVRWSEADLPVPVLIDPALPEMLTKLTLQQIKKLNRIAGRELLREAGWAHRLRSTPNTVVVTLQKKSGGHCTVWQKKDMDGIARWLSAAVIHLNRRASPSIVMHELLHAVGVGHLAGEDCSDAVMCASVYPNAQVSPGTALYLRTVYRVDAH